MQEGHHDLEKSLQLAVKEPKHIHTSDGGAILALCVHCIAVDSGFDVHADRRLGSSRHAPATDWNGKFENEWVLEYTRKGFLSVFTIHCSLQAASGRMFLHAREQDNPSNMRYMGLTVSKYIPDVKQAQSESWEGTINEQDILRQSLHELLIDPLLASAMPSQDPVEEPKAFLASMRDKLPTLPASLSNRDVLLSMAALLGATALIYLYTNRRQRSTSS
ncbi:g12453 [Coccomyxa viridis]|uniref:G12453 protein n=1 Tax=Coccomyxa viridis TaxID=1274662 RepID=A0ABP1GFV8_9CHLO